MNNQTGNRHFPSIQSTDHPCHDDLSYYEADRLLKNVEFPWLLGCYVPTEADTSQERCYCQILVFSDGQH